MLFLKNYFFFLTEKIEINFSSKGYIETSVIRQGPSVQQQIAFLEKSIA